MFLRNLYEIYVNSISQVVLNTLIDRAAQQQRANSEMLASGGGGDLPPTEAGSMRRGSAASTLAVMRRKSRFGGSTLSNATKIKMREEGQNVK